MTEGRDPSELRKMLEETPESERVFDILLDAKLRALFVEEEEVGIASLLMSTSWRLLEQTHEVGGFVASGVMHEFTQRGRPDIAANFLAELGHAVREWCEKYSQDKMVKWHLGVSGWCSNQKTYKDAFKAITASLDRGDTVSLNRRSDRYWTRDDHFPFRRSVP